MKSIKISLASKQCVKKLNKHWVNIERAENLDALQKNQKHIFFNIDQIMENSLKSKATKALIDFDYLDSVLIQSVTIKK